MDWIKGVVKAAGELVDKAVPAKVGDRTKWSVVGCIALGTVGPLLPAPWGEVAAAVQSTLCAGVPFFALAGVARSLK